MGLFQPHYLFWVGTCIVWWTKLHDRCDTEIRVKLVYSLLLLSSFIGMSVVVPYDMLSYFFLTLTLVVFRYRYRIAVPLLIIVTVFGALTRETQVLAITYAGVILVAEGANKENVSKFFAIVLPFVMTYAGSRLYYGTNRATAQSVELVPNFTSPLRMLGLLGALTYVLVFIDVTPRYEGKNRLNIAILMLLAPYLATILLFARVWEFRLIAPVLIIISFLHLRYDDQNLEFRSYSQLSDRIG